MYKYKFKSRDITGAIDRMRKIGNKVACMEDTGIDPAAAADLSGKLVDLADGVKPLWECVETLRVKAEVFLLDTNPEYVVLFAKFPSAFQSHLASSIVLAQLYKFPNSTTKPDDAVAMMHFLSGQKFGKSDNRITILALETQSAQKTQAHLVTVILEAFFKLTKVEFIKVMRALRSEGLSPSLENHSTEAWMTLSRSSQTQAGIDMRACSLMAYLLEADDVNYKRSRLFSLACHSCLISSLRFRCASKPSEETRNALEMPTSAGTAWTSCSESLKQQQGLAATRWWSWLHCG